MSSKLQWFPCSDGQDTHKDAAQDDNEASECGLRHRQMRAGCIVGSREEGGHCGTGVASSAEYSVSTVSFGTYKRHLHSDHTAGSRGSRRAAGALGRLANLTEVAADGLSSSSNHLRSLSLC